MSQYSYVNRRTGERVRYPRLGSFEVTVLEPMKRVVFSKFQSGRWPNVDGVIRRISAIVNGEPYGDTLSSGGSPARTARPGSRQSSARPVGRSGPPSSSTRPKSAFQGSQSSLQHSAGANKASTASMDRKLAWPEPGESKMQQDREDVEEKVGEDELADTIPPPPPPPQLEVVVPSTSEQNDAPEPVTSTQSPKAAPEPAVVPPNEVNSTPTPTPAPAAVVADTPKSDIPADATPPKQSVEAAPAPAPAPPVVVLDQYNPVSFFQSNVNVLFDRFKSVSKHGAGEKAQVGALYDALAEFGAQHGYGIACECDFEIPAISMCECAGSSHWLMMCLVSLAW